VCRAQADSPPAAALPPRARMLHPHRILRAARAPQIFRPGLHDFSASVSAFHFDPCPQKSAPRKCASWFAGSRVSTFRIAQALQPTRLCSGRLIQEILSFMSFGATRVRIAALQSPRQKTLPRFPGCPAPLERDALWMLPQRRVQNGSCFS